MPSEKGCCRCAVLLLSWVGLNLVAALDASSFSSERYEKLVVGTRSSELALRQTYHVIDELRQQYPYMDIDSVSMSTLGDKNLGKPLSKIGEKGLFTRELESALRSGEVHIVVHSLKDMPTVLPKGFTICAVMQREDPRDAVVMRWNAGKVQEPATLFTGASIGTSSLRRQAQLVSLYPGTNVSSIRGNLNTRLQKLDEATEYSGLVLAVAGLKRMGWQSRISEVLPRMLYAVGQGALAVECLRADNETLELVRPLHHVPTALRVVAERSFLRTLEGGCSAPVGVLSELVQGPADLRLRLEGAVWSLDGTRSVRRTATRTIRRTTSRGENPIRRAVYSGIYSPPGERELYRAAFKLGKDLANSLIAEGALSIMEEARQADKGS